MNQPAFEEIRSHIARAARVLHAEHAWLFGSWARGEAGSNSDVDVLFIVASELPRPLRAEAAYDALEDLDFPKDILVYTPEEFDRWRNVPGALCYEVLSKGVEVV